MPGLKSCNWLLKLLKSGAPAAKCQAGPVEMELRDQMQKVALESPAYDPGRVVAMILSETVGLVSPESR